MQTKPSAQTRGYESAPIELQSCSELQQTAGLGRVHAVTVAMTRHKTCLDAIRMVKRFMTARIDRNARGLLTFLRALFDRVYERT